MQRHRLVSRLVLAALTISALAAPAAAAKDQVPFNGSYEGTLTRTPLAPPFVFDQFFTSGNASHLGNCELLIEATVNTATRTAVGTFTFVAANGDTLVAEFTGASAPTATPGVILITETATITGGTGRFENATGAFVSRRLFNTATLETAGEFEGTISTVGSGKK